MSLLAEMVRMWRRQIGANARFQRMPSQQPTANLRNLRIAVATRRAAMHSLFHALGRSSALHFDVIDVPLVTRHGAGVQTGIAAADIVVIDVTPDPMAAIEFARTLRESRPATPVIGLLCCPEPIRPGQLAELLKAGVHHVVDSLSPTEEFLQLLRNLSARPASMHFALSDRHAAHLGDILNGRGWTSAWTPMLDSNRELLVLLTRGLTYADIGRRLDMSVRTVRRRIDELRAAVGAVNTIELAAWAGWYGLYRPTTWNSVRSG